MNRIVQVVTILVLGLLASSASAQSFQPLTVAQLLAAGAAYHEKRVSVTGFLHLEFENAALYDGKEADLDYGRGPHIWVDPRNPDITVERYSRKPVVLDGTFSFGSSGHRGGFPGEIRDITRVEILRP